VPKFIGLSTGGNRLQVDSITVTCLIIGASIIRPSSPIAPISVLCALSISFKILAARIISEIRTSICYELESTMAASIMIDLLGLARRLNLLLQPEQDEWLAGRRVRKKLVCNREVSYLSSKS
jgi:hypothetical protein